MESGTFESSEFSVQAAASYGRGPFCAGAVFLALPDEYDAV